MDSVSTYLILSARFLSGWKSKTHASVDGHKIILNGYSNHPRIPCFSKLFGFAYLIPYVIPRIQMWCWILLNGIQYIFRLPFWYTGWDQRIYDRRFDCAHRRVIHHWFDYAHHWLAPHKKRWQLFIQHCLILLWRIRLFVDEGYESIN